MSQEVGFPSPTPSGTPLSWSEVWIRAFTRPSVNTFEGLVHNPSASSRRAFTWMFISGLIGYFISMLAHLVPTDIVPISLTESVIYIFGAIVSGLQSVLGLAISAWITDRIARALVGTGTYSQLVYAMAAYLAPWSLILMVFRLIPLINSLVLPLAIYGMVLNPIAVKAVHKFGWGEAITSSAAGIFAGILVIVGFAVLGSL